MLGTTADTSLCWRVAVYISRTALDEYLKCSFPHQGELDKIRVEKDSSIRFSYRIYFPDTDMSRMFQRYVDFYQWNGLTQVKE